MRLSLFALLPVVPAALGCAGTVSGASDGVDAEAVTTTSAVVAVERTADSTEGSRAEASARFIRVVAPSSADDALRAIGASLDLPASGSCAAITSLAVAPSTQAPVVELLDVGGITLQADGVETRLAARQRSPAIARNISKPGKEESRKEFGNGETRKRIKEASSRILLDFQVPN